MRNPMMVMMMMILRAVSASDIYMPANTKNWGFLWGVRCFSPFTPPPPLSTKRTTHIVGINNKYLQRWNILDKSGVSGNNGLWNVWIKYSVYHVALASHSQGIQKTTFITQKKTLWPSVTKTNTRFKNRSIHQSINQVINHYAWVEVDYSEKH